MNRQKKKTKNNDLKERVVVISDLHFGDPLEMMTDTSKLERLREFLEGIDHIDEMVLLGDIFDFWKSDMNEALARGSEFMAMMYNLKNTSRLVFIPGNHDHHLLCLELYRRQSRKLKKKKIDSLRFKLPTSFSSPALTALRPARSPVPLRVIYPYHRVSVPGGDVLLTHGQLLGFFEKYWWREKREWFGSIFMGQSEDLGLEDIERLIIPYYEMLALSPATPGLVNGAYKVYRLLERIGGLMGILGNSRESARRYTTLEENVPDIEAFLDAFFPESPDCFVFGHTHKGGIAQLENSRETLVLNTGCWIDDERNDTIKGRVAILDKGFRLVNVLD